MNTSRSQLRRLTKQVRIFAAFSPETGFWTVRIHGLSKFPPMSLDGREHFESLEQIAVAAETHRLTLDIDTLELK